MKPAPQVPHRMRSGALQPDASQPALQRAVELRLAGCTLQQIRQQTGLSAPTVIGAYKRFLSAGWGGVAAAPRGRRQGQGRAWAADDDAWLLHTMAHALPEQHGLPTGLWTAESVEMLMHHRTGRAVGNRALQGWLQRNGLQWPALAHHAHQRPALAAWRRSEGAAAQREARSQEAQVIWVGQGRLFTPAGSKRLLLAQTLRGSSAWMPLAMGQAHCVTAYIDFLDRLARTWSAHRHVLLHGIALDHPALANWLATRPGHRLIACPAGPGPLAAETKASEPSTSVPAPPPAPSHPAKKGPAPMKLTHLQRLEAESIHILREVVAECERPVMLYSIGKDSATMLHLAKKAFYPSPPPFPLLHVDTTWKFRDMYAMRERMAAEMGMDLLVWHNPEAKAMGINPFDHGSQIHTDMWKTQGLKQALDHHGFDAAFGGARRDEEKSRAKERMFSFRSDQHRWDPKAQRPELWSLYNARKRAGESIRVFPISNWTELDIWQYIHLENIPIVPLYYAAERPVVERNGTLLMVDDERFRLEPDEVPVMRKIRFRTLGCYPLSGAIESEADTLPAIIQEMLLAKTSERQGRMIDHDQSASMEKKKQEGYF